MRAFDHQAFLRELPAAPLPGSAVMDLVMLGAYYAEMSDEDLLAQAAEGAGAFVPEAWTIIAHEISTRSLEMRPRELVVPDVNAQPEPVRLTRTSSDDLRFGVNTALVMAAYFALNAAVGLIVHWSRLLDLYLLMVAMLYVAAAVRMKRRQSVRAAAVAFALALASMSRHGYLRLAGRHRESSFWNIAMFAVVAYLFAKALLAARSLRDDRAAAALALAVSGETPSTSTSAGLTTP